MPQRHSSAFLDLPSCYAAPTTVGIVTYKGVEYQGRHEPLIDRQTFDRVQDLLDSRVKAGEKQRIHQHYLKGTIFCRCCQSRLSLTYANGHGGFTPISSA